MFFFQNRAPREERVFAVSFQIYVSYVHWNDSESDFLSPIIAKEIPDSYRKAVYAAYVAEFHNMFSQCNRDVAKIHR